MHMCELIWETILDFSMLNTLLLSLKSSHLITSYFFKVSEVYLAREDHHQ